jgi:FixJ family two-component response regulator
MQGVVLLIDDDDDVRAAIAEILQILFNFDCLPLRGFDDLLQQAETALSCDFAILDINLGRDCRTGVDVHRWLREHGFDRPVFFLTGHASSHPDVQRARALGDARVVSKPIGVQQLAEMLDTSEPP